ncbi:MAG: ABC transporter substrate-binding protein, partial [Ktedonobacteraceae bacterium]|nr:ABC transporter substrate-binding protein [Ktedonobacteraceae bacterium]
MDTHHDSYICLFRSCVSLLFLMLVVGLSACTSSPAPAHRSQPIRIGLSLSLSGDFSDDSLLFQQGYELWAKTVNQHGGLLGRPVQLDIVSDASSPAQVQTNYQKLITVNHD